MQTKKYSTLDPIQTQKNTSNRTLSSVPALLFVETQLAPVLNKQNGVYSNRDQQN
jgi:hypothetical protein